MLEKLKDGAGQVVSWIAIGSALISVGIVYAKLDSRVTSLEKTVIQFSNAPTLVRTVEDGGSASSEVIQNPMPAKCAELMDRAATAYEKGGFVTATNIIDLAKTFNCQHMQ